MKKLLVTTSIMVFFSMVALTAITPNQANAATTVDLDAVTNDIDNMVSIVLDVGWTYVASAIPTPDGEDSWNAWINTAGDAAHVNVVGSVPYAPGLHGWLNRYEIIVDGGSPVVVWDGYLHETSQLAFDNTPDYTFGVLSNPIVSFFIGDSFHPDNTGGISLKVSQVPIPGALWLLGSGLIGLVGVRQRFKR